MKIQDHKYLWFIYIYSLPTITEYTVDIYKINKRIFLGTLTGQTNHQRRGVDIVLSEAVEGKR